MVEYHRPIRDADRPPDWLAVHQIEKDKKGKEPPYTEESKAIGSQPLAFAALHLLIYSLVKRSSFEDAGAQRAEGGEQLRANTDTLRRMLLQLAHEDVSQSPDFAHQLAHAWHHLLDERPPAASAQQVDALIRAINSYPPAEEHTLGFYLTEYVGEEWLPFPYMELLRQLHERYQDDPANSALSAWIALLTDILASTKSRE
jgi:hypothetical protein